MTKPKTAARVISSFEFFEMHIRTPITLITGPLGSGKTTLLRHILATKAAKIAIVMNEFGEIAIDTKVIEGNDVRIAELGGGCVCCSLLGEFESAVKEIIEKIDPDIIVVETTGVAEPEALVFNIQEALPQCRTDGIVSVADADGLVRFPEIGHSTRLQFESADILLLNKVDLVEPRQIEPLETKLREINPSAAIIHTERSGSTESYCSASGGRERWRRLSTNISPNSNRSHSPPTKNFRATASNASRTACPRALFEQKALCASRTLRSFSTSSRDAGIWSRSSSPKPS